MNSDVLLRGYDVFGKAYGIMLRNDPHDIHSVEHRLMQEEVRVNADSEPFLYAGRPTPYPMEKHEMYSFSQRFRKEKDVDSIRALMEFTSETAADFAVELEEMLFGGTEKEILERGTDWCFDLARLAAVILDCIGIPTRFVFVANPHKAYYGHVLLETYYDDAWGVIDPLYGYVFFDRKPISAKDIASSAQLNSLDTDYRGLFDQTAIAEYDPNDQDNQYLVSKCNEYTYRLNTLQQDGTWMLGEDE